MTPKYVYKKRLLKLADHLESLKPERFDFGRWVGDDWQGKADLSCGTSACALGHATTIPSFRRLGLRLFRSLGKGYVGLVGQDSSINASENAARVVFDLDNQEFEFLFLPEREFGYLTLDKQKARFGRTSLFASASAKEVASQIRFLIKYKYGE